MYNRYLRAHDKLIAPFYYTFHRLRHKIKTKPVSITKNEIKLNLVAERLRGEMATFEIKAKGKVVVEEGRRITARHIRELEKSGIKSLEVPVDYLVGKCLARAVVDTGTGRSSSPFGSPVPAYTLAIKPSPGRSFDTMRA